MITLHLFPWNNTGDQPVWLLSISSWLPSIPTIDTILETKEYVTQYIFMVTQYLFPWYTTGDQTVWLCSMFSQLTRISWHGSMVTQHFFPQYNTGEQTVWLPSISSHGTIPESRKYGYLLYCPMVQQWRPDSRIDCTFPPQNKKVSILPHPCIHTSNDTDNIITMSSLYTYLQ